MGWSPQRPALAFSQARLQQLSQSLHNTKHYSGMLLFFFFLLNFFTLSLNMFSEFLRATCCLSLLNTGILLVNLEFKAISSTYNEREVNLTPAGNHLVLH